LSSLVLALVATLALTGPSAQARAQTKACDALPSGKKPVAREVLAVLHPYDGCDATFAECLAKKPVAPVVVRLANDVCRQVSDGRTIKEIEHALARRAQSLLPIGKPAQIAVDEATLAGDTHAPVTVVVYACARCPFCKVVVPALYNQVTAGSLQGKVRLYFRPFPLKDHPGSVEGGMAFIAATKLGRFWPFILKTYESYDTFCPQLLPEWAAAIGLSRADFERELAAAETREALVAAKQEGIRNKVDATPAIFINGRRYVYEMKEDIIIDVLQEAADAAAAPRKLP
jgi:protein-disulfide isomerase